MDAESAEFFKAYSHFWHPVALTKDVGDKPVPVQLLGRNLLVWRANGTSHVTERYCAHRGFDLAAATVEPDGLRCGYHGWKYAGNGRCVDVPQMPSGSPVPAKAHIGSYLTTERYGMVWTCLSGEPLVPLPEWPMFETGRAVAALPLLDWKISAGRSVENFLDLGHLSWVHRGTFGNPAHLEVAHHEIEPLPHGFRYHHQYPALLPPLPDGTQKSELCLGTYTLQFPYCAMVDFRPTKSAFAQHYFFLVASPVTIDTVRGFFLVSYDKSFSKMIERFARSEFEIQQQDRYYLERLGDPIHRIDASAEAHCEADKVIVAYRRGLRELVARAVQSPPHRDSTTQGNTPLAPAGDVP
jgi:vanillate O-demethylase monooxygenase subunit